jgi:glycosyltransferase involved in cell wall biosynthesis
MQTTPSLSNAFSYPVSKKLEVLHVVKDEKMGGVKSNLKGFIESELSDNFDFKTAVFDVEKLRLHSLRLGNPDLIIYHPTCRLKGLPDLLRLKARFPRVRLVVHEHAYSAGYEKHNVPHSWRFHAVLRSFYGLADRVVAISEAQADWMLAHHLTSPHKLRIIHQCPPIDRFFSLPHKTRNKDLVLGAYGRFCTQKGFEILIEAMRCLQDLPVQLLLGGSGELEGSLRQRAKDLTAIAFVGQVDNVPAFLNRCDAVVIPSLWEPWGNVCLEARAAAKPIIASRVDGLEEQVQKATCGLLVTPGDPVELAKGIRILALACPWQLVRWGEQGRASAQGGHQRYLAAWKKLMWEVLA